MAEFEYPEVDGMDAILLTLELRNSGDWMGIYDSLQIREKVDMDQVMKTAAFLDDKKCGYITLLNENYPENYKAIYKPPFGVFYKGDVEMIKAGNAKENTITVIGNHIEALQKVEPNTKLVWVNKTQNEIDEIMKLHPTGNIFYTSQFKDVDKNKDIALGNCFISEVWEKSREKDYSNQLEERIYLGITKKALITKKANANEVQKAKEYSHMEDIQFVNSKEKQKSKGLEMAA